jgi:predicted component of type VI protein secretion system
MFVSVVVAKLNDIDEFCFFMNSSKRLEQLFGIVRSFQGGNMNFDVLGLRDRLADSCAIAAVCNKHPNWDSGHRRLQECFDRKNTTSWRGDVNINAWTSPNVGSREC